MQSCTLGNRFKLWGWVWMRQEVTSGWLRVPWTTSCIKTLNIKDHLFIYGYINKVITWFINTIDKTHSLPYPSPMEVVFLGHQRNPYREVEGEDDQIDQILQVGVEAFL